MIVLRLVNWLKNRIATVTALRRRKPSWEAERVPLLVGHSVSNWLDNGRRLRPSVAANTPHIEHSMTLASASYETNLSPAQEPVALSHAAESTLVSQSVGTSEPNTPSSPPAATETHPALLEGLEGIELLDATQRGLVYLKYLVRHGVYNEGYQAQNLPSQYHHSAGLDESLNEQN